MKRSWTPILTFLLGLGTTVLATWFAARYFEIKTRSEFNEAVAEITDDVRTRIEAYVALLRGCSGLFAVRRQVTAGEFRAFVARLDVNADYPGVQGIGYAGRVRAGEEERLIERMRAQGDSDFKVWPEGPREEYFPILFLEPRDRRNAAAIGYDMFSDPARRAAMEAARDRGGPAASGRVTLVQEIEGPQQPGFLIYVPVYREGDVPVTIAERRASLVGFAYSPFRAGDLFRELLGPKAGLFALRVFDSPGYGDGTLLYDHSTNEKRGRFASARTINVAGRAWALNFESQPAFDARAHGGRIPLLIFLGGIAVTFLLFYFTHAETRARQTAEQTALRLKRSREALQESEQAARRANEQLGEHATRLERMVAERTAHLEQSIASLEGVLYHVAHDLRAPLRAMHGFTSILLQEYGQHFDETGKEYARRVAEAAGRMDELIHDLLEYGRLCHMALPLGKVQLEEPVKRVLAALQDQIDARQARVEIDASAAPVVANPIALEAIVTNLVTNSLKFVAPGKPPNVRVCAEERDGVVRLSVKDNGIGIDPRFQDRVFRVFEQLHQTDHYPGTGIGLAIVQKAAQRMHAKVGLQSTVGEGSTFWVELPKYGQ